MLIHKKILFSLASFGCAIVMWQAMKSSCPPKEQHMQAMTDVVEKAVDRIFEEKIILPEESKELASYLMTNVIPPAVEKLTRERLDFSSYGIFSLGTIEEDGKRIPVSVGVLGKVFTLSENDAYNYFRDYVVPESINDSILTPKNKTNGKQNTQTDEGQ